MTRTESIGRILGMCLIAALFAVYANSLWHVAEDGGEMSAIANDSANRKAHERTAANIAKKGVMANVGASNKLSVSEALYVTAPVTDIPAKVGNDTGAISTIESAAAKPVTQNRGAATTNSLERHRNNTTRGGSESTRANDAAISATRLSGAASQRIVAAENSEADKPIARPVVNPSPAETPRTGHIPLRPIQEDAWKSTALAPANRHAPQKFYSSAESAATAVSIAEATPNRPHAVQHPTNPRPFDLSGLPMYRLSRVMTDGATIAMEETEDIITTVTFRRNDPRNKVDLTHPVSICVEYPDAADHARSCGAANWMAPDTNDLTIDVVMPRRNTSGEPYARFGQNITCNVTYYDEREGAHTVMATEQWSGGDCGAVAMIVVGGQP